MCGTRCARLPLLCAETEEREAVVEDDIRGVEPRREAALLTAKLAPLMVSVRACAGVCCVWRRGGRGVIFAVGTWFCQIIFGDLQSQECESLRPPTAAVASPLYLFSSRAVLFGYFARQEHDAFKSGTNVHTHRLVSLCCTAAHRVVVACMGLQ